MTIWTGQSEDGSDARIAEGVFANPDGSGEWSTEPYPGQPGYLNRAMRRAKARRKF